MKKRESVKDYKFSIVFGNEHGKENVMKFLIIFYAFTFYLNSKLFDFDYFKIISSILIRNLALHFNVVLQNGVNAS